MKRKVYAYITHRHRLLVFSHLHTPEAGMQVPGGTVEPGEEPAVAVLREAREETGLDELIFDRLLGDMVYTLPDDPASDVPVEMHHRFFYHLRCIGDPPTSWQHHECFASASSEPIALEFFWFPVPDGVPALAAEMGSFLPQLLIVLHEPDLQLDWGHLEGLLLSPGVVVDRAKGSPHPRFPQSRYPVDYGYVPETIGGDGEPIDVFVGSDPRRGLVGVIATRDECKRDKEIKLLWQMTEEEIAAVLAFVNRGQMSGRLLRRPPAHP